MSDAQVPELPTGFAAVQVAIVSVVFVAVSYGLVRKVLVPRLARTAQLAPIAYRGADVVAMISVYLGIMLLVGLVAGFVFPGAEGQEPAPVFQLGAAALVQVLAAIALILLVRRLGATAAHLGLDDPKPLVSFAQGVTMYLCCVPAILACGALWALTLRAFDVEVQGQEVANLVARTSGGERWMVFAMAALLIPFLEEFLFRGFLQNWLVGLWGGKRGLLAASLFFAALHGVDPFGGLIVIALAAGLMLRWTGSLWACFGVHAVNNAVAAIVLFSHPDFLPY